MQPTLAPAPHRMGAGAPSHNENPADQGLRELLLSSNQHSQIPNYHQRQDVEQTQHNPHTHNIDPAIASSSMNHQQPQSAGEGSGEGEGGDRRGKRELSNSKRAAQNRAAQRAFRQRKESHIKTLENQVREYENLSSSFKALQAENYALRDYIISLQNDLMASGKSVPAPPPHINLQAHREGGPPSQPSRPGEGLGGGGGGGQPPPAPERDVKSGSGSMSHTGFSGQAPLAAMSNMPSIEQQLQESAAQAVAQQQRRDGVGAGGPGQMSAVGKRPRTSEGQQQQQGMANGLPLPRQGS